MKYFSLSNGDQIPALGLGTWKSQADIVGKAVETALALGYRHIDCAAIYGNETAIGSVLGQAMRSGQVRREELWITSKLWSNAHAPDDVIPALQKSLGDLGLDYLDLYLVHWPVVMRAGVKSLSQGSDLLPFSNESLRGTWQAMEQALDQGLCRHIGVSNFSLKKLQDLLAFARRKPEMNQVELHPYLQQSRLLEFAQQAGILLTGYAPLGSGDRPDTLKKAEEPSLFSEPVIQSIASHHRITPAQVLLAWAIERGTITIPKSVNPTRLKENLAAADISLSATDLEQIAALDRHYRYVSGDFWMVPDSPYSLAMLWDEDITR